MQTLYNGVVVPTNSDEYNLTADLAGMGNSVGAIRGVGSVAARDALAASAPGGVLPVPTVISRTDVAGSPLEIWDGTVWRRPGASQHAEFTGPVVALSAGLGRDIGALSLDTSIPRDSTFVQPDTSGALKVLVAGIYNLSSIIFPSSAPGNSNASIDIVSGPTVAAQNGGYGTSAFGASASSRYLAANTVIRFSAVVTNGTTIGSRVVITRIG